MLAIAPAPDICHTLCSSVRNVSDENDFSGSIPTEPPTYDTEDYDAADSESRRLSRVSWGDEEIHEFVRQCLSQCCVGVLQSI
eukprot:COSAG02_NODE_10805_length_1855_cov_1.828588_2_plen_83_part_00